MMTTIKDYRNIQIPSSDICIVGTGPAGMEIANCFDHTNTSVTLIESGGVDFDCRLQNLHRFQQKGRHIRSIDQASSYDIELAKNNVPHLRQFGGTLNIWGGKWKILDGYDFSEKPYVEGSSWPISKGDLYPYYKSIAKDYDLLDLLLKENNVANEIRSYLTQIPSFTPSIVYEEQPPLNIKERFFDQIERSSNIRLILGANVVNIQLSENLMHVNQLTIRSIEGQNWKIKAKIFILACGTIGNARLLLSSNRQIKSGIGNEHDWVGRNFIDHPKGTGVVFIPSSKDRYIPEAYLHYHCDKKKYRAGISISPDLLRKWELPNHYVQLFPFGCTGPPHMTAQHPDKYLGHFFLEQLPNRESRLFLTDELDEIQMPIACIDWKFKEQDFICFRRFVDKLKYLFHSNNLGEIFFDEKIFQMQFLKDAAHQMGTTKMALSPEEGVVDANCKVFGTDNLYIAGASVFPSGGNANPTFTVLALSRRLAHHLLNEISSGI